MSKGKSIFLISVGALNLLHGLTHLFQFVQSLFLITYSVGHHEDDNIMHSPILSIIWAIVGISSLVIGIRDYRHHKKCHDNHG
jgi:uncharacterized membrane protein YuzA (DUF378 family)